MPAQPSTRFGVSSRDDAAQLAAAVGVAAGLAVPAVRLSRMIEAGVLRLGLIGAEPAINYMVNHPHVDRRPESDVAQPNLHGPPALDH